MSDSLDWQSCEGGIREAGVKQKAWWRNLNRTNLSARAHNLVRVTNLDSDERLKHAIENNLLEKFGGAGKKTIEELAEYCGAAITPKKANESQIQHAISLLERNGYSVTMNPLESTENKPNKESVSVKEKNIDLEQKKKRDILIALAWVNGMTYKEIGESINLSSSRCAEIVRKIIRISHAHESRETYRAFDQEVTRGKLHSSHRDEYLKRVSFVSEIWIVDMVNVRAELKKLINAKKS